MNDLAVAQSLTETTNVMDTAASTPSRPTPSITTANGNSAMTTKGITATTAATTTTVTSKGTTIGMFRQTTIVQWLFAFTISFYLIM